jgi:hypothetical protein
MVATNDIRREVEAAARQGVPGQGVLRSIDPLGTNRGSYSGGQRFRLTFDSGEVEAYLKIHRRRGRGFEDDCLAWAEEEFELLSGLHEAAPSAPPLDVVKPLVLIPSLPGILLERHPGVTLNSLLKGGRLGLGRGLPAEELCRIYRLVGEGLRQLHGLLGPGTPLLTKLGEFGILEIDCDKVLQDTERMLNRVLDHCRADHRAAVESGYRYARRAFLDAVERPYPRHGTHGDFTPVNMFVHDGRPTFFDFVNFHLGHPLEDVGRFLSYTRFLRKDPFSKVGREVGPLCEAFMEGYGLRDWRANPVLVLFFQRSMFRTLSGGLRFQSWPWPLSTVYVQAMRRALDNWIAEGMALP